MFNKFKRAMNKKVKSKESRYGDYRHYSVADINHHLMQEIEEWKQTNDFHELVDIANCCAMIWTIIFDDETRNINNYYRDTTRKEVKTDV